MNEIASAKDTAEYLQIHIITLYRMAKEKRIPCAKIGAQYRFRKSMVDKWLTERMKCIKQ